jgi:hypothetical protein
LTEHRKKKKKKKKKWPTHLAHQYGGQKRQTEEEREMMFLWEVVYQSMT